MSNTKIKNGLVIDEEGTKRWYKNSKLHRDNDLPAVEWNNSDKDWYLNGKRHREDGPAIELTNGDKYWYINGKLHRENSPAMEYADGSKEWWIYGQQLSEAQFNHHIEMKRLNQNLKSSLEINIKKSKLFKV